MSDRFEGIRSLVPIGSTKPNKNMKEIDIMLDLLNVRFYGDDDDFDWSDYLDDEGSFHDDTWRDWD